MEFIVLIRNAIVGAGDHDGPPKIGSIFGFPEGKSSFFRLRRCDFVTQNHRGVEVAAPYDESDKLKSAPWNEPSGSNGVTTLAGLGHELSAGTARETEI